MSALLSDLLLFHRVLDLWFVLQEAVAIPIRLVSLLHFVMKSNKKNGSYSCTSSPSFFSPPPPPASCQLLCVEIYIMRVEYRNLSVSTIKHNDVIRALKQKSYHIVLAQLFEAPNNAIQRINRYPADKRQRSALCYASDRDLSNGYRYPPFDQPRSARLP